MLMFLTAFNGHVMARFRRQLKSETRLDCKVTYVRMDSSCNNIITIIRIGRS